MVRWSDSAAYYLHQIYNYISNDSPEYARKVISDMIDKTETLEIFPEMGKMVEEINDSSIREVIVYSYRIIYELVEDHHVNILALVHERRNFSTLETK